MTVRGRRPAGPGAAADQDVAEMIRVNHAGEYGAMRIYEGASEVLRLGIARALVDSVGAGDSE